ncbi:MAG: acyl carrier protein [Candidatus Omnitrophica bacterium]|nr:acyl carrier protein [Candidatus Omnitrophota bacterium]
MGREIDKELIIMLSTMTGFEPDEIKPEMNIVKDLGVDSLKVIEIATAIEQKYKVVVKENEMAKIQTVGQAIKLVEKLLKKKKT